MFQKFLATAAHVFAAAAAAVMTKNLKSHLYLRVMMNHETHFQTKNIPMITLGILQFWTRMHYIDSEWARSMVNMDEILKQNWTYRKMAFFGAYAMVVGILVYMEFYRWSWFHHLTAAIGANLLPLSIAFFSFEPIFLLVLIIFTTYPKPRPLSSAMPQRERYAHNAEIAIIVPCHRSNDVAVQTVSACLKHVRPEQIFIVDNGSPLSTTGSPSRSSLRRGPGQDRSVRTCDRPA